MNHYFTTREGAIRRLIAIGRGSSRSSAPSIVVGTKKDGTEVNGIADVLSAVRAGRIASFLHSSPTDTHVVFIS